MSMGTWSIFLTKEIDGRPGMYATKHKVTELAAKYIDIAAHITIYPDGKEIWLDSTESMLVLELLAALKSIRGKEAEMVDGPEA